VEEWVVGFEWGSGLGSVGVVGVWAGGHGRWGTGWGFVEGGGVDDFPMLDWFVSAGDVGCSPVARSESTLGFA